jgi:hypothetical protein
MRADITRGPGDKYVHDGRFYNTLRVCVIGTGRSKGKRHPCLYGWLTGTRVTLLDKQENPSGAYRARKRSAIRIRSVVTFFHVVAVSIVGMSPTTSSKNVMARSASDTLAIEYFFSKA